MTEDARRFLAAWFTADDLIEFRVIYPDGAKPPVQRWGKLADLDALLTWAAGHNEKGGGVYAGGSPRTRPSGAAKDVALARGVFADLDGVTLAEAGMKLRASDLPAPTMTVASGGGVHYWWLFDEPMTDLQLWTRLQKGIIAALDSDPCIHDWPRIMRLPGFVNTKPKRNSARAELLECEPERAYPHDEFPEAAPSRPVADTPRPPGHNGTFDSSRLTRKTLDYLATGETVPEGERHGRFIAAVIDLVSCGASPDHELVGRAKAHALASGKPEAELDKGIRDAFSQPRTPATAEPKTRAKAPPVPPWQAFPVGVLPDVLQRFALSMSESMNIDPAMIALPSLGACAGAIGNAREIQLTDTWVQPSILWPVLVVETGTVKTPALTAVVKPLWHRQIECDEKHAEKQAEYDEAKRAYDNAPKGKRGPIPVPPVQEEILCDSATVEAMVPMLEDNWRGLLAPVDEVSSIIGGFNQYKSGGADSTFWLRAYDAGFYKVNRKTGDRRRFIVRRCSVSIIGTVQPTILQKVIGTEHRENGLLGRMLLASPPPRSRSWAAARRVQPRRPSKAYRCMIEALLTLEPGRGKKNRPKPARLCLSDAAAVRFGRFYEDFDPDRLGIVDPDLRAAYSKLTGAAGRFALVLHEVRIAAGELRDSDVVDPETVEAAITMAWWFAGEARRVYRLMREPPEASARRRLVVWIQSRGGTVTARDLYRNLAEYKGRPPEDAEAALAELHKAGLGVLEDAVANKKGGQPTRRFRLHGVTDPPVFDDGGDTTPIPDGASGGIVAVASVGECESDDEPPADHDRADALGDEADEVLFDDCPDATEWARR